VTVSIAANAIQDKDSMPALCDASSPAKNRLKSMHRAGHQLHMLA